MRLSCKMLGRAPWITPYDVVQAYFLVADSIETMTRYFTFIVNDDTWTEHDRVGIAGINDPGIDDNRQANANRQKAIAEISGIREDDVFFFNCMRSPSHPPQILGIYEAASRPYFDTRPLYPGAIHVHDRISLRIEFRCLQNFPNPVNLDQLWGLKERGKIWTIQQSRGDVLGRHACNSIATDEAKEITKILMANNPIVGTNKDYMRIRADVGLNRIQKEELPFDLRQGAQGQLHYEASAQALILEGLADGRYQDVFGDYDEFIPFVSTGAQTEIDLLLLKHFEGDIVWFNVVELKGSTFSMAELQRLIDYEKWIIQTRAQSPLQVHPIGVGANFSEDVIRFVRERTRYRDRAIRLLEYTFVPERRSIELRNVV